ncbi:MAG: DUF2336 domain-containing protein [Proteobacteria bacterium]|nr:DUF2336 domain-containing protein [Pseudomonadota bacterium]
MAPASEKNKHPMLSSTDVAHLLENPSPAVRVEVLGKISSSYNSNEFTAQQMKMAEQIFRALLKDAEISVRHALSENVKNNPNIPRDIVLELAHDADAVAIPVLQYSEVLMDDDLIEIIKSTESTDRLLAISNRSEVSEKLSDALVDTKNATVVSNMLSRVEVKFSEMTLSKTADIFTTSKDVTERLAARENLPVKLVEKLVSRVSDILQDRLLEKYGNKSPELKSIIEKSREAVTLQFLGLSSEGDIRKIVDEMDRSSDLAQDLVMRSERLTMLIEKLEEQGRLSPISALCMGHLPLFEISIARVTHVPVANVKKLVADVMGDGFRKLYERAELPKDIFDAVKLVVRVLIEMDHEHPNRRQPAKEMIQRLLTLSENEKQEVENLSYFISMIHQHSKISGGNASGSTTAH